MVSLSIINFNNIPCLLSKCNDKNSKRKTTYTVEAISLNNSNDKKKYWIGINQVRANRYIEYLLGNNLLNKIINCKRLKIERERKLGNSKLDFLVGNAYLEVKTPLIILDVKDCYHTNKNIEIRKNSDFNSLDRLIKHLKELLNSLKSHEKAFLVMLFMFDAVPFVPPVLNKKLKPVFEAFKKSIESGLEMWQINMVMDKYGIELKSYHKMDFDDMMDSMYKKM